MIDTGEVIFGDEDEEFVAAPKRPRGPGQPRQPGQPNASVEIESRLMTGRKARTCRLSTRQQRLLVTISGTYRFQCRTRGEKLVSRSLELGTKDGICPKSETFSDRALQSLNTVRYSVILEM